MTIYSGFLKQCENNPEQTAFVEENRRLSYTRLLRHAEKVCAFLVQQSPSCKRVACAMDRGINAAITIYGISMAGACYIPLDINNPENRLRFIIEDADVQFIIGCGACPAWLEEKDKWLDFEQIPDYSGRPKTSVNIDPSSLAAILYTSGSTGTPKGVALSHPAICNFVQWAGTTFQIGATDRIASLTPFHFDLSVFDLFTSLSGAATVFFVPTQLTISPSRLSAWLQQNKITTWYTVPSILSFIALKGALETTPLTDLRQILFAGEVFPVQRLLKLSALLPHVNLYNLYGPTETNVCCYWPVDRNRLLNAETIPIGYPACGAQLKIDDINSELLVKSANNLSGYWQHGRLHRHNENAWYRTGDKVSLNKLGEYCYHGRLDRMLKCSGYRVEPAEIESVINQLPGIENCAVIGISDTAGGQRPAAVVVLQNDYRLTEIVKLIRQKLPAYMQPCKWITLPSLPRVTNGKIDYQALQQQIEQHC